MKRSIQELKNDATVWAARQVNGSFSRPDWVSLNLTLRCNLKCTMCTTCYDSPELSTTKVFDIIDQVSAWGVKVLNPLGGEPFVREDLVEILEYAARKDLFVTLTTNGTLISPEHAKRIARIPSNRLHFNFSIDGFREVHDNIRGRGMLQETLDGFSRIREADALRGQPARKILVNTVVNDKSLDAIPAFIEWCRGHGFSGIQLLNLFKHGHKVPKEIKHLWIGELRWQALDQVVEDVKAMRASYDPLDFEIVNSPHQLEIMKAYYRGTLPPRKAPCFAGWKELYINATGQGIMCDGKLDFLNGQFGDVHRQSLRQMWESDTLKARRQVVKACESPCIQDCYLRENSNNMWGIVKGVGGIVADEVRKRVRKPPKWIPLPGTELTLELSDIPDRPTIYDVDAGEDRYQSLVEPCPVPFEAVYEDPFLYYDYRNKGYLNFNRGFLGFELVKKVGPSLSRVGQRFDRVRLGWRGEPLLHPEFSPLFEYVISLALAGQFGEIRLDTNGGLLNTEYVDKAVDGGAAHSFVVDLDAASAKTYELIRPRAAFQAVERNLDYLLSRRADGAGQSVRLVASFTCLEDNEAEALAFRDRWLGRFKAHNLPEPKVVVGAFPESGDAIWFKRQDCDNFLDQLQARTVMERVAKTLGIECLSDRDTGAAPRCAGPFKTPTVSWDGKVTLCRQDRRLMLRAGEITVEDLAHIWWAKEGPQGARRAVLDGTLHQRSPCRDCQFPFSPNAPTLDGEEQDRYKRLMGS